MQFLGASAVVAAANRLSPNWLVAQDLNGQRIATALLDGLDFTPVPFTGADTVTVPASFKYEVLIKQGDVLNPRGDRFGDDNDYLALLPTSADEGWVWCNHETAQLPTLVDDWSPLSTKEQAALVLANVGGSCVRMRRNAAGFWRPVLPDKRNFRLNGLDTVIPLTGPACGSSWVKGAKTVIGSVANCGGGISPWGTFFSAEENFQNFYGNPELSEPVPPIQQFFPRPPEHYGYMVEIDPATGKFYKHSHLGKFSHENIAFTLTKDGRLAAYMGDDHTDQYLYKFISRDRYQPKLGTANRDLLNHGTLYVAQTVAGKWLPLDPQQDQRLTKAGFDLARICVQTRSAAKIVGATPLARPEDVEVHPQTGDLYISLTAYALADEHDPMGALARLQEEKSDAGALNFKFEIFVAGGVTTGVARPDNLTFTPENNLIVASDYRLTATPKPGSIQDKFGNNFLLIVPTQGSQKGTVRRFAVAPRGAEFCSPSLCPERRELWVNVQHPGEGSTSRATLLSHWPDGGESLPKSSLIAISRE